MRTFEFQLVTPERQLVKEQLLSLSCPTTLGEITVLAGHAPLVATLVPGELKAKGNGGAHYLHVAGGFIEVRPSGEVVVLADAAEHHYEIDEERAEAARQRAKQRLSEQTLSDEEYATVAAELERSLSALKVARKHAHRRAPLTSEGVFNE